MFASVTKQADILASLTKKQYYSKNVAGLLIKSFQSLLIHLPDQGVFFSPPPLSFSPSLESFKSPYEALGSSYGRTELIPLNLTGGKFAARRGSEAEAGAVTSCAL